MRRPSPLAWEDATGPADADDSFGDVPVVPLRARAVAALSSSPKGDTARAVGFTDSYERGAARDCADDPRAAVSKRCPGWDHPATPYAVIVMQGLNPAQYAKAVGPFPAQEDALNWLSKEGIPELRPVGEGDGQWGVVVPFESRP